MVQTGIRSRPGTGGTFDVEPTATTTFVASSRWARRRGGPRRCRGSGRGPRPDRRPRPPPRAARRAPCRRARRHPAGRLIIQSRRSEAWRHDQLAGFAWWRCAESRRDFDGHAADVRAAAADPAAIDDRHARASMAGLEGGRLAGRARADDHEVEGVRRSPSLLVRVSSMCRCVSAALAPRLVQQDRRRGRDVQAVRRRPPSAAGPPRRPRRARPSERPSASLPSTIASGPRRSASDVQRGRVDPGGDDAEAARAQPRDHLGDRAAATTGTLNTVPTLARITFGLNRSVPPTAITAVAPTASAERRIAPTLPGFSTSSVTTTSGIAGSARSARVVAARARRARRRRIDRRRPAARMRARRPRPARSATRTGRSSWSSFSATRRASVDSISARADERGSTIGAGLHRAQRLASAVDKRQAGRVALAPLAQPRSRPGSAGSRGCRSSANRSSGMADRAQSRSEPTADRRQLEAQRRRPRDGAPGRPRTRREACPAACAPSSPVVCAVSSTNASSAATARHAPGARAARRRAATGAGRPARRSAGPARCRRSGGPAAPRGPRTPRRRRRASESGGRRGRTARRCAAPKRRRRARRPRAPPPLPRAPPRASRARCARTGSAPCGGCPRVVPRRDLPGEPGDVRRVLRVEPEAAGRGRPQLHRQPFDRRRARAARLGAHGPRRLRPAARRRTAGPPPATTASRRADPSQAVGAGRSTSRAPEPLEPPAVARVDERAIVVPFGPVLAIVAIGP